MSDESELFPETAEELMLKVRRKLSGDLERAEKRLASAGEKVDEALLVLQTFDAARAAQARAGRLNTATGEVMGPVRDGDTGRRILEDAASMVNAGALGPDVSATVVPAARP